MTVYVKIKHNDTFEDVQLNLAVDETTIDDYEHDVQYKDNQGFWTQVRPTHLSVDGYDCTEYLEELTEVEAYECDIIEQMVADYSEDSEEDYEFMTGNPVPPIFKRDFDIGFRGSASVYISYDEDFKNSEVLKMPLGERIPNDLLGNQE